MLIVVILELGDSIYSSPLVIVGLVFLDSSGKSFADLVPVNNLPHLLEKDWPGILVVDVVGMFPDVHVKYWHKLGVTIWYQVLVRSCVELKSMLLFVVRQPTPAATLDSDSTLLKPLLKLIETVPSFKNEPHKLRVVIRTVTILRGAKTVPKELVIKMSTSVELERLRYLYSLCDVVLSHCFWGLLNKLVQIVYVCAMMFAVVEVKQVSWNYRFECV